MRLRIRSTVLETVLDVLFIEGRGDKEGSLREIEEKFVDLMS